MTADDPRQPAAGPANGPGPPGLGGSPVAPSPPGGQAFLDLDFGASPSNRQAGGEPPPDPDPRDSGRRSIFARLRDALLGSRGEDGRHRSRYYYLDISEKGLATSGQARAAIEGLLQEKKAEIGHATATEGLVGELARLRRDIRTLSDEIALAEPRYTVAARHFLRTPVILGPLSTRVLASLYILLAAVDLVTLRAVFSQANFETVDTWTLPTAFTIAIVGAVTLAVRFGLSSVEPDRVNHAKRAMRTWVVVALVGGLVLLTIGLMVKANVLSVRRLAPPAQLQLWSGYAMFAGLVILQATLSGALAAYQYTPGATEHSRARGYLLDAEKELRRLAARRGRTEAAAHEIDARLGSKVLLARAQAGAGRLRGLDRSFAAGYQPGRSGGDEASPRAARLVDTVTDHAAPPLQTNVVIDFQAELERLRKGEPGPTQPVTDLLSRVHAGVNRANRINGLNGSTPPPITPGGPGEIRSAVPGVGPAQSPHPADPAAGSLGGSADPEDPGPHPPDPHGRMSDSGLPGPEAPRAGPPQPPPRMLSLAADVADRLDRIRETFVRASRPLSPARPAAAVDEPTRPNATEVEAARRALRGVEGLLQQWARLLERPGPGPSSQAEAEVGQELSEMRAWLGSLIPRYASGDVDADHIGDTLRGAAGRIRTLSGIGVGGSPPGAPA